MRPKHNCIICMYDDHYEIVGPFTSEDALSAYGKAWQARNGDRPTWQSIFLANPCFGATVIIPA